jgi:hypothetical protein
MSADVWTGLAPALVATGETTPEFLGWIKAEPIAATFPSVWATGSIVAATRLVV